MVFHIFSHYSIYKFEYINNMSKNSSEEVFELIRAMSQAEKRYFKRYLLLYGGKESNIGKLFDAFNKQKSYDEEKLKRSATYLSGFAQHKKRLGEIILRSLRSYHANATTYTRIKAHLIDAAILRQKRLYKYGISSLKKAGKLAAKTEDHLSELIVYNQLDEFLFDARDPSIFDQHRENLLKEKKLISKYAELVEFKSRAKEQFHNHYYDRNAGKSKVKDLSASVLKTISFRAKRHYLNSKIANELQNGRAKNAYKFAAEHVKALEQNSWLIVDHPYEYLKALSTQLVLEDIQGLFERTTITIDKMRELHRSSLLGKKLKLYESHTFVYTYTTELNALSSTKAFAQAGNLIPVIHRGLEKNKEKITLAERKVFYYNFSILSMYNGDPKMAFRWATKALSFGKEIRADLNYTLHLIRILSVFDRQDMDFFPVILKKEFRVLNRFEPASPFTLQLMNFLESLIDKNSRSICSIFRDKIKAAGKIKEMKKLIPEFDFVAWLETKITGRTIAEIL
jgi:hypothetical protein